MPTRLRVLEGGRHGIEKEAGGATFLLCFCGRRERAGRPNVRPTQLTHFSDVYAGSFAPHF